jgi:hypothetical protein
MNMKKFITVAKQLALAGSDACIALSSCSNMNDLHDKYLQEGEIIYAAKVDSVAVLPGRNRARMSITVRSQRIETVRIYWNDYLDSADVAVNGQVGVFSTVLEGMEENDYIFYMVDFDKYGNKSLPFEASGTVYGDRYASGLSSQRMQTIYYRNDTVTISWIDAPEGTAYSELTYTDGEGLERTLQIPPDAVTSRIGDWASNIQYRTVFRPEAAAIDTFCTEWKNASVATPHPAGEWSVAGYTGGYHLDMKPENAIDGDPMTIWYTNTASRFPFDITVDFGDTLQIDGIVFQNKPEQHGMSGSNWPKRVKWEASNDVDNPSSWKTILELEEMSNTEEELWLPCTMQASARYLKFTMYSGWKSQQAGYIGDMGAYYLKN